MRQCLLFLSLGILFVTVSTGCGVDELELDGLFLRPLEMPEGTPAELGIAYEEIRIRSAENRELAAWFMPAPSGKARGTLLVHTGMAGNRGFYLSMFPCFLEQDLNILIYDYQGFGGSDGEPDFDNFEADAHAAVDYLLSRPEPSAHVIVHLGGSLGSLPGTAIAALESESTAGLIIFGGFFPDQIAGIWLGEFVSPFLVPVGQVAGLFWHAMLPEFMHPRTVIPDLETPILAVIPEGDEIVPQEAQVLFFDALPEPKQVYYSSAPHSPDAMANDPEMCPVIGQWLDSMDLLTP